MKGAFMMAALAVAALSDGCEKSELEKFTKEFERRSDGNVVRGNNNDVTGSRNNVQGCQNRLMGDSNDLNGDFNMNFGSGSDVKGNDNWVVGNDHRIQGDGIRMFGPDASAYFLNGGYRREREIRRRPIMERRKC